MKFDGLGVGVRSHSLENLFRSAQCYRCLGQAPSGFVSGNVWRARICL
jgi:hypothetical protein